MNQGMNVQNLIAEVGRQKDAKRDFVASARDMKASYSIEDGTKGIPELVLSLDMEKKEDFVVSPNGKSQLATFTGIPKQYFDKMAVEAPELLATNVNTWLEHAPEKRRLVRTLDNRVRALMSDRYSPRDNYPLALLSLNMIQEKGAKIVSSNITEDNFYIKAKLDSLTLPDPGEKRVGQFIEAGIVISNSEVGLGSLRVDPMAYILACINGMISSKRMARRHIGKQFDVSDDAYEVLTEGTRAKTEEAFWAQVQDVLNASFNEDEFAKLVATMSEAAQNKVPDGADIPGIIEVTTQQFALPKGLNASILDNFIREGDLSQLGVMNAVTNEANKTEDYEVSTQLERAGGKIINLNSSEWSVLANQKAA